MEIYTELFKKTLYFCFINYLTVDDTWNLKSTLNISHARNVNDKDHKNIQNIHWESNTAIITKEVVMNWEQLSVAGEKCITSSRMLKT